MWMPSKENSVVVDSKITDYLLNLEHQIGGSKAKFFMRFGFKLESLENFRFALKQHAINRNVASSNNTGFGMKYELICEIETPDTRNPCITTIWIINNDEDSPRLVTAFPS